MANKPLDGGVIGPPEQGLPALQAEWLKVKTLCAVRERMGDGYEELRTQAAVYARCADALTPHIAAQQALTAERDRLRAAGDALASSCTGLCAELDYLEKTDALCVPSLGAIERIEAALAAWRAAASREGAK